MAVYDVLIVPFIVGIVELVKKLGLPSKFCPVVSVVLGVIIGLVYISPNDIAQGILVGASLGLSAVGLYSGTKNTKEIFD
ncbi:MAG: hypothetical protein WBI88_03945 [Caldicoprobacterales bacterium]